MSEGAPLKKIIIARSILDAIDGENGLFGRGNLILLPARTSEEILNLHGVHHADVIITDLGLPLMGGADLCAKIRSDPALRHVSIIMACGRKEEAVASGIKANALVALPVDPVELFSTVADLLVIPQRKTLRVLMSATLKGQAGQESFLAVCHNISISGMLIETNCRLNAGDQLSCTLTIAHREISMDCRVVRATAEGKRWQCAVAFVTPNTKSLILIDQYVKNQIGR